MINQCNKWVYITKFLFLIGIDNNVFGINPNWELLTPQGFRFYLPGDIGPGWLDASTTAQVEIHSMLVPNDLSEIDESKKENKFNNHKTKDLYSVLHCTAQECPTLLRKGIIELFPNCLEVMSPQLSIITISQKTRNKKTRWSKEVEVEKLAQHVSDCLHYHKLKFIYNIIEIVR